MSADDLDVISLDLDGTLIHPAIFNVVADALGFGEPLRRTFEAYKAGKMTIPECFVADYKHFVGRSVDEMHEALARSRKWTDDIDAAVERFQELGIRVIVTTDQPSFLADFTREFGVDDVVCSPAEVVDGVVTAKVEPRYEKWPNLSAWLTNEKVSPTRVAHVGNGGNDIPVFQHVGASVAVNPERDAVGRAAQHTVAPLHSMLQVADVLLGE
ncbi:MAG: HAD family hydrolase [Thermoplasmatota archaeon]